MQLVLLKSRARFPGQLVQRRGRPVYRKSRPHSYSQLGRAEPRGEGDGRVALVELLAVEGRRRRRQALELETPREVVERLY